MNLALVDNRAPIKYTQARNGIEKIPLEVRSVRCYALNGGSAMQLAFAIALSLALFFASVVWGVLLAAI
jgi:hypothetical protein